MHAGENNNEYSTLYDQQYEDNTTRRNLAYYSFRLIVVVKVLLIAIAVPNINVLLIISGSLLGTIITVIIPVVFYHRAYSGDIKNLQKDRQSMQWNQRSEVLSEARANPNGITLHSDKDLEEDDGPFNDQDPLMSRERADNRDLDKRENPSSSNPGRSENSGDQSDEMEHVDKRSRIKAFNIVVLVIGCSIGLAGFINVIDEIRKHGIPKEKLDT